ncbi:MAG TPA: MFS transporter [Conexibacter sp.]
MEPRGDRPLHRNRDYALLWSGQAVSELGSQITLIAYPLLVLAATGSSAQAGFVAFAKALPMLLVAVPAGALADRFDRRLLLVACDAARALALASLVLAIATGSVHFVHVAAVAFVDGSGFALSYVAERGALRNVVPRGQLSEAVARNEARTYGAMLLGPPLGGILFAAGRLVPFAVDSASYAASTTATLLLRGPLQEERVAAREPLRRELAEGARWLWQRPFFRFTSLFAAGMNPVFAGLYLLAVVRATDGGSPPGKTGVMFALVGLGGLLGALAAPRLQRLLSTRQVILTECWLLVVLVPTILLTDQPILLGLIIGAAELLAPVTNSVVQGTRIAAAPDALQGRVQAAAMAIAQSVGWAGPLVVGVALSTAGADATIVGLAVWVGVMALAATRSRALRSGPGAGAFS